MRKLLFVLAFLASFAQTQPVAAATLQITPEIDLRAAENGTPIPFAFDIEGVNNADGDFFLRFLINPSQFPAGEEITVRWDFETIAPLTVLGPLTGIRVAWIDADDVIQGSAAVSLTTISPGLPLTGSVDLLLNAADLNGSLIRARLFGLYGGGATTGFITDPISVLSGTVTPLDLVAETGGGGSDTTPIPLPAAGLLLLTGFIGLYAWGRHRPKTA